MYKASREQTCCLTLLCVKLTYIVILQNHEAAEEVAVRSARLFCEFSSLEECK